VCFNLFVYCFQVLRVWYEAIEATAGTVEECAGLLESNELVAIAPGGDREMCFSDENYTLVWQNRKGFAKVAIQAKSVILNLKLIISFFQLKNIYFV